MGMRLQQISDYGTSNPIVARLTMQTKDLLQFYDLTDEQRNNLFGVFFSNLQPKLLACFRVKEKLADEVRSAKESSDEPSVPRQTSVHAYTLPSVFDLEHLAASFLYSAKSVLRDLTDVFTILFGKDFKKEARYDKVLKWARQKFGDDDALVEMLKDRESNWIERIVQMRNAVEHPGGYSGVLHIENFASIEHENTIRVVEPIWYLNDDQGTPVVQEMELIVANVLTFCEEVLLACLQHFKTAFPLVVVEVPEAERDLACPVRFKATIDQTRIKASLMPSAYVAPTRRDATDVK